MSSDEGYIYIALALGFGGGIFYFFEGFRVFRQYRVLADTPVMPIRSIPMGLVEVHGKAKGEQRVTSPLTHTPCFFYKVVIERWETDSKGRGRWAHFKTVAEGVKFNLEDMTGKVLVVAQGAEYDLIETGKREIGRGRAVDLRSLFGGKKGPKTATAPWATVSELLGYVQKFGARGDASFSDSVKTFAFGGALSFGSSRRSSESFRFTEYCIRPDHWYDVTGTCTENPNAKDEHDRNMIVKGENEPTFLISWRSEKEIERALRNRAALYIFGGAAASIVCLAFLLGKLGLL